MYFTTTKEDTIRIPPDRLGDDIDKVIEDISHLALENRMTKDGMLTLLVTEVEKLGEGRIIHGDGGVYQQVKYNAIVFKPEIQEVIEGSICEVLKFGAFVRFGPLDGLIHISQVMDDKIDVDESGNRLMGKDSKRDLKVGDKIRARIVSVSFNERNPRESRIGLTMRQVGLGKFDWMEDERKKKAERDKKKTDKEKEKEDKKEEKKEK